MVKSTGTISLPRIAFGQKPLAIPVSLETDFYELFRRMEGAFETCFLFESLGEETYASRYSIIGFDPKHIISARENTLFFDGTPYVVNNPYAALRVIVPQNIISRSYAGGLFGYMSYDAMRYMEPSLKIASDDRFSQFMFGVFQDGLVHDTMTGETTYFCFETNRLEKLKPYLAPAAGDGKERKPPRVTAKGDTLSKDEHKKGVQAILEEIKAGNTFQCQFGFKSLFRIKGDTLPIYTQLRRLNPSPHMYYLKFGDRKIIGASPELLFRLRQGEVETFPLAGTVRRGNDDAEDKALAKKLLNDPKELAEHTMLVDLHRNDVGRVARFGTVKVRRLMDVKRFSHVQHISSEVVGILKKGEDMFSGLASVFPAGTLTGAPKIESMKIIERMEKDARGPYGGAVGHFGFDGDCTFAIPIRTLFIAGEDAYAQASGGIVYDSHPEDEYQEIQQKLAIMKQILGAFGN